MMTDLIFGCLLIAVVSGVAFSWGRWLGSRRRALIRSGAALAAVVLTLWFAMRLYGRLIMAQWLPISSVIIVGNWIPLGLAFLAGVASSSVRIPRWRRVLIGVALISLSACSLVRPLLDSPPAARENWTKTGVCLQSNRASCSACAAATLLNVYGIRTGESEMMRLCLTGKTGTPQLGLYRGLERKTRGRPHRVQAFHATVDELLRFDNWPVVLLVRLDPGGTVDPRYEREWGWTPGLGHAVVVFGLVGEDRLDIGDPSIGREQWTITDLRTLWHGEGIRLIYSDSYPQLSP